MSSRKLEKPVVVLTAPYGWGDVATDVTAPYYARLYPKYVVDKSRYDVVILEGQDANTEKFKEILEKYKGRIIMVDGVGHGGPWTPPQMFTGWRLQPLLKQPTEPNILDNAAFKPISCEIGLHLVPELAERNKNFLGIAEIQDYWIVVDFTTMHKGTDWGEDPYVESFLRVEFETAKLLLNGVKGKDAYEKMLELYEQEAKKWDNVDPETAQWLRWDAYYRKMFGNPDWQSQQPEEPPQPPQPPPQQCMHECPWCNAKFDKLEQLKKHIADVHQKDICPECPPCEKCKYKCPWCNKDFDTADQLKQHIFSEHLKPCKLSSILRRKLNCPLP
jgi:hypothetical protein